MGKSSKVPPPDPRLVEAQVKSMGVQDQAAQQILELARQQTAQAAELMPLQKETMQFALDANRKAYDQTQQDREYALAQRAKLDAQTNAIVNEADTYDTEAAQNQAAGAAAAGVGKAYGDVIAANDRTLAMQGVMPGSSRQMALREAAGVDLARATVGAANEGRLVARNEGRMLRDRAASALSGAPGAVQYGTATGAQIAAGGVNTANAGAGGIYSGYSAQTGAQQAASGTAGQTGANASSMYGAQAQYKLASDQTRQGWLGGVGSLLGGAARVGSLFVSDRRAKTDIVRLGAHPQGFGVYEFSYRPGMGPAGRHVGVMADEVEPVLPAAVVRDASGLARVDYSMI